MDNKNLLDISWGTIFKVTLAFFCFYFLYLIRDVLILAFFALIFSILFNPAIDFLQRKKIPRSLAVIFVYLGFFGIISLFIYLTASLFLQEVQQFSQFFPQYFEKISPYLKGLGMDIFESSEIFVKTIHDWLIRISSNTFSVLRSIFGGFFSVFLVITISVFLSLEENFIEKSLILIFPKKYKNLVLDIWQRSQVKISNWFAAKIIGCLFVGALSFLTFFLFNVKYYFLLAFLAGILDFVPIIGPISTGILILLLISPESITKSIFALIAFVLIQQIEGNILIPILTKKFIGLPSVLVLISLAIGGKLWGVAGAILIVPLAGILYEILKEILEKKRAEEEELI